MRRSGHLQVLRGVAALLVFCLHSMFIEQKYGRGIQFIGHGGWLGAVAVDLFFALSGFIMISITNGRFQSLAYAARFWLERFFRVYPSYWAISLPVLVLYLIKPGLVNSAQGGQVNLLESFLLLPQPLLPLLAVGWTLVHEMYFYLVFTLAVAFLPERWRVHMLVAWASAILIGGLLRAPDAGPAWLQLMADPLTLDFIAGGLAALVAQRMGKTGKALGNALVLTGVSSFGVLLWAVPMSLDVLFFERWWRVAVCALPCAVIILGAVVSEQNGEGGGWLRKRLERLGDLSYSFYLVHLLVLSAAGKVWAALLPATFWAALLVYGLSFACCVVVAQLSHRFIEMPSLSLGRTLAAAVEQRIKAKASQASHA